MGCVVYVEVYPLTWLVIPLRMEGLAGLKDTARNVREMYSKDSPYCNVPVDNRQFRSISVSVHNCDICDDRLECNDDIESQIDMLNEIDDSFESEYDKAEPKLLLCGYCQKEYLIPRYN